MDIIFASSNPHLPQTFGGVELNTHELALGLKRRGHNVAVLTVLSRVDLFGLQREAFLVATRNNVWSDSKLGYEVHRAREPWACIPIIPRYQVAIMTNGRMVDFAKGFLQAGTRTVAYLHGVTEFKSWDPKFVSGPHALFAGIWSFSEFTAQRFRQTHGLGSIVIRPIFQEERYKVHVDGRYVTFINPVPEKGVDRALEIAALCPDIQFVFVRGWPLGFKELRRLKSKLRQLPNVQLQSSTYDIRTIHRHTKILLVPTSLRWEETWGRVVSEAQISGIPVIASNHGALPESVGNGGILIDYEQPAEIWATEVRKLWMEEAYHAKVSQAAIAYSRRMEISPKAQLDLLEASIEQLMLGPG
jgi:glycosyltransferase involved in cell wall biosynthesis